MSSFFTYLNFHISMMSHKKVSEHVSITQKCHTQRLQTNELHCEYDLSKTDKHNTIEKKKLTIKDTNNWDTCKGLISACVLTLSSSPQI